MMLLSQLNYFRVVARHEHISHAAEELRVAQPALSATISKIEKELGVPLFNRTGRNIELNDAGRRLLDHADYMFDKLEEMEQVLARTKEVLENELTLSVSNSMFLNGWLQQFVLENPKARLRQKMLSENEMLEALLDESIDVALGEFDADVPGIVRKVIVEDEYVITIPKQNPLSQKEQILFDDIRDENIVALPSNTIYKIADRIFAQRDCRPKIVFEGAHRLITKMLYLDRGLLFSSRQIMYMAQSYLKKDNFFEGSPLYPVIMQPVADVNSKYSLALCWKEGRELPAMAWKFIEAMQNTYPDYHDDEEFENLREVCYPAN